MLPECINLETVRAADGKRTRIRGSLAGLEYRCDNLGNCPSEGDEAVFIHISNLDFVQLDAEPPLDYEKLAQLQQGDGQLVVVGTVHYKPRSKSYGTVGTLSDISTIVFIRREQGPQ
ncbi:MAG: hypothetical protein IT384_10485 [Deltaproteobacteria bacterium]|nr:hypothetical protein [Deltaproteobacteria bacterium]